MFSFPSVDDINVSLGVNAFFSKICDYGCTLGL